MHETVHLYCCGAAFLGCKDPVELQPVHEFYMEFSAESRHVDNLVLSSDGTILVANNERTIQVWNLQNRAGIIHHSDDFIEDLALDETTNTLAYVTGGRRGRVVFLDISSGEISTKRLKDGSYPTALAVSGDSMAVVFHQGGIHYWEDVDHDADSWFIPTDQGRSRARVALEPDGGMLWSYLGRWGRRPSRTHEMEIFSHQKFEMNQASLSPNGIFFATYKDHGCSVHFYRIPTGTQVRAEMEQIISLHPHKGHLLKRWSEEGDSLSRDQCDRLADEGKLSPLPLFQPLHTFPGFLETHHDGLVKVRNFTGEVLGEFQTITYIAQIESKIDYDFDVTAVGIPARGQGAPDGGSPKLFAVARGPVVAVYKMPAPGSP